MFKVDGKYYKNNSYTAKKLIKEGKIPIKGYVLRLSVNGWLTYNYEEDEEIYESYDKALKVCKEICSELFYEPQELDPDDPPGLTIEVVDFDTGEIVSTKDKEKL